MYVKHVLAELTAATAARVPGSMAEMIKTLPKGLIPNYERHWRLMKSKDRREVNRLQKPIILLLATAREAVTAGMVADWMNEGDFGPVDEEQIREVLLEDWAQFIHVEPGADEGSAQCRLSDLKGQSVAVDCYEDSKLGSSQSQELRSSGFVDRQERYNTLAPHLGKTDEEIIDRVAGVDTVEQGLLGHARVGEY